MNSISKTILLSAVSLFVDNGNLIYASEKIPLSVPKSGIQTLHTHHTHIRHTLQRLDLSSRLFDDLMISGEEQKVASVCFITDAGNCSGDKFGNTETPGGGNGGGTPNGNDGDDPEYDTIPEQCEDAGYTKTSCPTGQHLVNPCPSDNRYYERCECNENLTEICNIPYYGVGPSCDGKYASCQRDDDKACRNAGYTQTASCPTLQVPNQKCPYNASYYDKCVCQSGLVTCSSPQIGVGTSCGGKYQSCQCPSSYKSCDCGGAVGASSCTINGTTTYSSCKSCCDDTCPSGYSKSYPSGCYDTSRTECGNTCYKSKSCCDSSYKYTCTGSNQSPSGTSCDGKYASCSCSSGYMWKNGSCQKIEWGTCTGLAQNCSFGDILNLDGTCTYGLEKGKIAIGIVVYKSGNCGQAIGLGFSTMDARWYAANPPLDIPELPNYATEEEAFNDFNSCANTKILISDEVNTFKGKPSNIVEVALSVKTYNEGFVSDTAGYGSERIYIPELKGKWCVPAAGILKIVFDRKTEIDAIEKRIPNVSTDDKGILSHPVGNPYFDYGYASSTEIDDKTIWSMIATSSMLPDGFMKGSKTAFYAVRPVIEF